MSLGDDRVQGMTLDVSTMALGAKLIVMVITSPPHLLLLSAQGLMRR